MKRILFLLFLNILLLNSTINPLQAQCDPGAPECGFGAPICLPFSSRLPEFLNNSGPIPGCGGTFSFHNTSWYQITVTSNTLAIVITPSNCQDGLGYQAGLYTGCRPSDPALDAVQCSCTLGSSFFSATSIPPGNYYIMLDGCAGDICNFDISLVQGEVASDAPAQPAEPVGTLADCCPGEVVSFTTDIVAGAETYNWSFPAGMIPLNINCNEATVICGGNGGIVTVSASNVCNGTLNTSPPSDPAFIDVGSLEGFVFGSYCFPEEPGFFYAPLGLFIPGGTFEFPLISSRGCDSVVTIIVEEFFSFPNNLNFSLCPGESVTVAGEVYADPIDTTIVLPNATADGCDSVIQLIITTAPELIVEATLGDDQCNACVGFIDITPTSGVPPYQYSWSNGEIVEDLTNLCAGTYSLTITDANGCTAEASYTINDSGGNNLTLTALATSPNCTDGCDGSLVLNIACGTPPYQIDWEGGLPDGTNTQSDLCADSYSVTVSDNAGLSNTATFIVTNPAPIEINASIQNISCFGANDGSTTLSVSGGSPPYLFSWNDLPMANTATRNNLSGGPYTAVVTDANGCTATQSVFIAEPAALAISLDITNLSCTAKGSAVANPSGGTMPYSYLWSNGSTTSSVDELDFGSYGLTVTDANGCSVSQDFDIIDDCCELVISLESTDILCGEGNVGTVTVNIDVEGTPPYSIEWSDPDLPAVLTLNNLEPGIYAMTITDATGCMISEEAEVLAECCPEEFTLDITDESCTGINDGAIEVDIDNPITPPYTFEWSDPNLPNESTLSNLSPGAYALTLTNGDGCSKIETFEIASSLNLEVTTTFANCDGKGGTATATADGFFLSFFWSNGGSGSSQSDLGVGDYAVTVYSLFGGCRSAADFTIEEDPACPDDLVLTPGASIKGQLDGPALSMQVLPNPVVDVGQIRYELSEATAVTLELYDLQGRRIRELERVQPRDAGQHQVELDLSDLEVGTYWVRLQTATGQQRLLSWVKMR
ncbi:MAG: T9SS type A sorting domain-containing protein [Bacteroidota bacterium]